MPPPNWPVAPGDEARREDDAELALGAVGDREGHAAVAAALGRDAKITRAKAVQQANRRKLLVGDGGRGLVRGGLGLGFGAVVGRSLAGEQGEEAAGQGGGKQRATHGEDLSEEEEEPITGRSAGNWCPAGSNDRPTSHDGAYLARDRAGVESRPATFPRLPWGRIDVSVTLTTSLLFDPGRIILAPAHPGG